MDDNALVALLMVLLLGFFIGLGTGDLAGVRDYQQTLVKQCQAQGYIAIDQTILVCQVRKDLKP